MDDTEKNKLFVGGISWDTSEDLLREHFGKYGTVSGSVIAKNRDTGNSRGFAFVTLSESSALDRALQDSHQILGRMVEVKRAIPRNEHQRGSSRNDTRTNGMSHDQVRTKKIFVGGLAANLTVEEFTSYFGKFGRINDVVVMHDNVTHRPRGFGFITFDSEDSVDEVMQKNFHELTGKYVEVKRAVPKDNISSYNINGGGLNSNFNSYEQGSYSYAAPYDPRFGYFPNIPGFPYGSGFFDGFGYGFTPMGPRSPWVGPTMVGVGVRGGFLPYGNGGPVYPNFFNGGHGVMGLPANNVYANGFGGKPVLIGNGDAQPSQNGKKGNGKSYSGTNLS